MQEITVDALIVEMGGTNAIGERLDIKAGAVRQWRWRGIPREHWAELIEAHPKVTLDRLKAARVAEPKKRAQAA